METSQHCIGGAWVPSSDPATIEVRSPADGALVGVVPAGCAADAADAVAAAKAAQPGWAALPVDERADVLHRAITRARGAQDELARLQSLEMGQPITLARDFTAGALGALEAAVEASRSYAWTTQLAGEGGARTQVVRRPYGVGALILPWNFPLMVGAEYLGGLLATGNTVVYKPSERSPLSAVRLVEALGLPPGVLNLLLGDIRAGAPLVEHEDVGIAVLTGSVASGRAVGRVSGERLRPVVLELGGKDPVIVDDTVDPVWAAAQVARGAFLNTGQICTSMERVYVLDSVADRFVGALVEAAAALKVGDPLDEATEIGPLVDERQRRIVHEHVEQAVAAGATVLLGGEIPSGAGTYYPPTVLVDVTDDMTVMREETFGPVAPVRRVGSFEEALALAADSAYGLAATVLTDDPSRVAAAAELPVAIVWVNEWWGGAEGMRYEPAGSSGVGVVGGLDPYTTARTVHVGSAAAVTENVLEVHAATPRESIRS